MAAMCHAWILEHLDVHHDPFLAARPPCRRRAPWGRSLSGSSRDRRPTKLLIGLAAGDGAAAVLGLPFTGFCHTAAIAVVADRIGNLQVSCLRARRRADAAGRRAVGFGYICIVGSPLGGAERTMVRTRNGGRDGPTECGLLRLRPGRCGHVERVTGNGLLIG